MCVSTSRCYAITVAEILTHLKRKLERLQAGDMAQGKDLAT